MQGMVLICPLSDPPQELPWLLECKNARHTSDSLQQDLRFYSLASGETGMITVPECCRGMVYHGPGHGFLLVSAGRDLSLLNPLTGVHISLPRLDYGLETIWPVCSGSDPIHNWHIVSRSMSRSDICVWRSVIYHHDKKNWTFVDDDSRNTCCQDGMLFATEELYFTGVFDAISGEESYEVPPPEDEIFQVRGSYLVESRGEILRLSWYLDFDGTQEVEDSIFYIYKLYSKRGGGGQHCWVKVGDIGGQIVFLDVMNGFSMRAPAGFKGNCIYFMLEDGSTPCRYDIGTGTVERVPCPFECCTWFIPNLG